jgi:hypothetical protein
LNFLRVPLRTVEYTDSRCYQLTIERLPWGASAYTIEHERLDGSHDLARVENRTAHGNRWNSRANWRLPASNSLLSG